LRPLRRKIKDDDTLLLAVMAKSLFSQGKYGETLKSIESYLGYGGNATAQICHMKAACLVSMKRPVFEIDRQFKKATALSPDYIPAINDHALFLATHGENERALVLSGKLLKLAENRAFSLDTAGFVNLRAGRLNTAKTYLQSALLKKPNHPEILLHNAILFKQLGKSKEAQKFYDRALEILDVHSNLLEDLRKEYLDG